MAHSPVEPVTLCPIDKISWRAGDLLPFSTSLCPDKLMQEIWESGNFGHGDERYGERPTGKWANKRYTLKRIFHKMHLSLGYAFDETFWWLAGLALLRFKEMIKKK